ncbi:MAG: transcription-repair coupling factor, partial [Bacteroidales bacterium]|nr:transcription-repair coupling factor [Bacteroidales bacterium]
GRSNKKAFCYLLTPPFNNVTPDARRRLKAIEEFSELGSGFNIAMQDLDIRGSGNLLGGEQSGFIADVGFETYQRILNEAMLELRQEGYSEGNNDLKEEEGLDKIIPNHVDKQGFVSDIQIDTDFEIMFPDEYVSSITERISLYKELNDIKNEEELTSYENKLIDLFGPLPKEAKALLDIVKLKWIANKLGMEKIIMKNGLFIAHFVSDPSSSFYRDPIFISLMNYINRNQKTMAMKQKNNILSLTIKNASSIKAIYDILIQMVNNL